jgi:hypothetical protein
MMQRYTIFFITVNAVHVSGGFFAHHQEVKNCTHSIGYMSSLLDATASVGGLELERTQTSGSSTSVGELELVCVCCWMCIHIQQCTKTSGSSKQASHIPDAVRTVFELLMVGGEAA